MKTTFLAVAAGSWMDFKFGKIDSQNIAQMGIDCARNATGNYYLQTNEKVFEHFFSNSFVGRIHI